MCFGKGKCQAPKGVRECTECEKCGDVICRKIKRFEGEMCWQCRYLHMHWNGLDYDEEIDPSDDIFFHQ